MDDFPTKTGHFTRGYPSCVWSERIKTYITTYRTYIQERTDNLFVKYRVAFDPRQVMLFPAYLTDSVQESQDGISQGVTCRHLWWVISPVMGCKHPILFTKPLNKYDEISYVAHYMLPANNLSFCQPWESNLHVDLSWYQWYIYIYERTYVYVYIYSDIPFWLLNIVTFSWCKEALSENGTFPADDPKKPDEGKLPVYLRTLKVTRSVSRFGLQIGEDIHFPYFSIIFTVFRHIV